MWTPNVLMTELRDLLYNKSINIVVIRFFIYPTGPIRVCKIDLSALVKIVEPSDWYARIKIPKSQKDHWNVIAKHAITYCSYWRYLNPSFFTFSKEKNSQIIFWWSGVAITKQVNETMGR